MNGVLLNLYLTAYQNDYKRFMGIDKFPTYDIRIKETSLSMALARGYEAPAAAHYVPKTQKHTLTISSNVELHKQFVYHEFTHMLDSEMYVDGDPVRYAKLSGFTEYHASQVELMKLLGAQTVDEKISFSMSTIIDTYSGKRTVSQYVEEKRLHAVELFSRQDFPADLDMLKSAVGVLFNYFGLRSICEMYATDYTEKIDNDAFLKHISVFHFAPANGRMRGWLNKDGIEKSMDIYWDILWPLLQANRFV